MKKLESRMKKFAAILLLLSTGCAHELTAPLSTVSVTSMADYFWTGSAITFKDDSTGAVTNQITFRDSSNFLLADDADASGKIRTTIACAVSQDTVFAENFVLGSVLDMDYGSYFSPLDTETLVPHVLSAAVISGDSAYVATDSGVWSASVSGRFGYDGIGFVSDIDALASSPTDNIYAATRSGKIWVRDPGSRKWSTFPTSGLHPNTAIIALACDASALYAIVDGQASVYRWLKGSYSWQLFIPLMSTNTISAIRADVYLNGTQYLTFGSKDGTVGGYPTSGGTQFLRTLTGSGSVYDIAGDNDKFLGAATGNGIFLSDQTLNFPSAPAITAPPK